MTEKIQKGLQHSHGDNYMEGHTGGKIREMVTDTHLNATCKENLMDYTGGITVTSKQAFSVTTRTRLPRLDGCGESQKVAAKILRLGSNSMMMEVFKKEL